MKQNEQAQIGKPTPNFGVSEWVQGSGLNFSDLKGKIILLEVFQVNCPGCFSSSIPEAIKIHNKYKDEGVVVLGLATAFEDFDKNTLENLKLLVSTGEVIGETKHALTQYNLLNNGKLQYQIPFPIGMDKLTKASGEISEEQILNVIQQQIPQFSQMPAHNQAQMKEAVKKHLSKKEYSAETFDKFSLQGTPSSIIVDREGILREVFIGQSEILDFKVKQIIQEGKK